MGVLEHAERIGEIRRACGYYDLSRSVFYLWKKVYETDGNEGLVNKKPCPVNFKLRTPPSRGSSTAMGVCMRSRSGLRANDLRRSPRIADPIS